MIFGMSYFTCVHVLISLIAIASGLVVLYGLLTSQRLPGWTLLFLVMTIATSVTGFLFPLNGFTPAIGVGILSIIILAIALLALYSRHLAGSWRWIYVVTAVVALYLNVFVLVVQSFLKISSLHVLAPKGNEPPFVIAQGIALLFFVVTGILAARRFRPPAV